jgi:hypothetical protein
MKKTTEAEASDVEATTEAEAAGQKTEATHGADSRTAEHKTEAAAAEHKQAANEKRGADKRAADPSWDEPYWQTAWESWPPSSAVADIWPAASASDADIWPAASASGATAAASASGATAAASGPIMSKLYGATKDGLHQLRQERQQLDLPEEDLAGATPASSTDRLSDARESEFYNNRNCRKKRRKKCGLGDGQIASNEIWREHASVERTQPKAVSEPDVSICRRCNNNRSVAEGVQRIQRNSL